MTESEAEAIIEMVEKKMLAALASSRPMHQRFSGHEGILEEADEAVEKFRDLVKYNNSMIPDIRE